MRWRGVWSGAGSVIAVAWRIGAPGGAGLVVYQDAEKLPDQRSPTYRYAWET